MPHSNKIIFTPMTKHDPKVVCFDREGEVYAYNHTEQEEETLVLVFDRAAAYMPEFYGRQEAMLKQLERWNILFTKVNAETFFSIASLEVEVKTMMPNHPGWSRNKIIANMFLENKEIQRSFKSNEVIQHGSYSTKLQVGGNSKDNMILSLDLAKGSDTGVTVTLDKGEIVLIENYIASMVK